MAIACDKLFSSWSEGKRKKGGGGGKEGVRIGGGGKKRERRGEGGGPGIAMSFQEHSLMTGSPLNSAIVPTVPWAGDQALKTGRLGDNSSNSTRADSFSDTWLCRQM